ncbi:terminase [Streptomyces niveus]|uniref:terminase n=1 Tax=Streptomyces niveus TaxID=193462 RepID=UPI0035D8A71E
MIGCQTPRILSVPWRRRVDTGRWDGTEDQEALDFTSPAGQECIDLAEDAGLHLDPWQQLALHHTLVEDREGRWLALDAVLNIARQNGKGGFLEARQLGEVILFGGKLVIHTAHQFNTAQESFLRLDQLIEGSYALSRRVKRARRSHGEEGFEFFNGARIRFLARGGDSGRGFSGDLVLMDEAMKLRAAPIGALMPVLSARPNPQLVYTGSAGLGPESEQLALLRSRALGEGEPDPSLAYLEHSIAPHVKECPTDPDGRIVCEHHDDRGDEASFARANPALGIRIRTSYVLQEMRSMRPDLFDRERLGVGDYPEVSDETWQVISKEAWEACEDSASQAGGRVAFSIEVNPERTWAAISVAGAAGTGVHSEVVEHRPGTDWVIERAKQLDTRWDPCAWVVDEGGPAGSLVPGLRKALRYEDETTDEGEPREPRDELVFCPKVRELTQACGQFYDRVAEGTLWHIGLARQAPMATALAGAKKRDVGDAWLWSRRSEGVDVSPLASSTYAVWGWEQHRDDEPEEAEPWGFYG